MRDLGSPFRKLCRRLLGAGRPGEATKDFASPQVWVATEIYSPAEATGYFMTQLAARLSTVFRTGVLTKERRPNECDDRAVSPNGSLIVRRYGSAGLPDRLILFRALNALRVSWAIFIGALQSLERGSVIIVVTNPPTLPFAISLAARLCRAKCILLIHDLYPDVLVATGVLTNSSLSVKLLDSLTRLLYRNVSTIIVLGRDMERRVRAKALGRHPKIHVIPNWADLAEIFPRSRQGSQLLDELGIADRFVVQYSGNMGRTHAIEDLVEVAAQLNGDNRFHFLLIGGGAKRRWVDEQVATRRLSNVTVLSPVSRSQLGESMAACDVSIIAFVEGMAGISVPSRMYTVLAAGRPLIGVTEEDSELATVIREDQVGWVVQPNNRAHLLRVLEEARCSGIGLVEMGTRARMTAERTYSVDAALSRYQDVVLELLAERASTSRSNEGGK